MLNLGTVITKSKSHSVTDPDKESLRFIPIFLPVGLCDISGISFSLDHVWSDSGAVDIGVDDTQDTRDTTYTSRNDKHCRRG